MVTSNTKQTLHKERVHNKNAHHSASKSRSAGASVNEGARGAATSKKIVSKVAKEVIKFPLSTEKTVRLMESENKLLFEVALDATKSDVKAAVEKLFKAKVVAVRTMITPDYKKRASVQFAQDTPAIDIATELGLI